MSDPLAVMCERHEREHGGEEARWKARPLLDDTCHLCVMERENVALRKRVEELERESQTFEDQAVFYQARAEQAERELDEARRLAEDACSRYNESLRTVTCAFCGLAYPPSTPTSGAEVLAAHVAVCEKHPMRALQADLDAALDYNLLREANSIHCFHDDFDRTRKLLEERKALLKKQREARRG